MKRVTDIFLKVLDIDWRYHLLKTGGYASYSEETSGKTLEFIGTSGVGKTTLYNGSVVKLRSRWFFSHHLEFLNRTAPSGEADEILMRILERRIDKIINSDSYSPWNSLLDLKLSMTVMYETMLVAQSVHPKGIIFEEGLFRHFPAEILELGDQFPPQLWNNRAFIYLRADNPETALSRVIEREMSAAARKERRRVRSNDQILSSIVKDQEMFQIIADKAPTYGCPVLVIDAESPFEESVQKVLEFERSLHYRFDLQEKKLTSTKPVTD